ncbi:MAG: hydantoinase B/oxoprolinase family protein, partial [Gammaproteobacteria bacterium]
EYRVEVAGPRAERVRIAAARHAWLEEDAAAVATRYRSGELDMYDVIRRHGVICDWGSGELLPNSTRDFRAQMRERCVPHWQ